MVVAQNQQIILVGHRKAEVINAVTQISKLLKQNKLDEAVIIMTKTTFTPEELKKVPSDLLRKLIP